MGTTLKRGFLGSSLLLISAIFASVLSFGKLAEAQPLKEVRIASSTTVSFTNLSTFYARDKRFFEKEGLEIKIIKHYGLGPKDVSILATGDTMARIAALQKEAVDAAIIPAPGDMKAIALGDFKLLLDVGTLYKLLGSAPT